MYYLFSLLVQKNVSGIWSIPPEGQEQSISVDDNLILFAWQVIQPAQAQSTHVSWHSGQFILVLSS